MSLPILDLSDDCDRQTWSGLLTRLRATASLGGEAADTVAQIVEAVRTGGDDAVVQYMRKWTDPEFTADHIRVAEEAFDRAEASLDPALRASLEEAIGNVRAYQEHILPRDPDPVEIAGATLGLRFSPVESAGLTVPGGTAVLVSSVIMLAVPAIVAGVDPGRVRIVHPPPTRQGDAASPDIRSEVLATCRLLGIDTVYRIGGAQGVAALAHGTERVEPVGLIAGPGNVYVQLAKQMVSGTCGTDGGFYGPSEIVTVADEHADPVCVASDLVAQAEHDPGKCFLVAWSRAVIERIVAELERQLESRGRIAAIEAALANESACLLVADEDEAASVADEIAAEHVNLAVADPDAWLARLRNGGEFFLGDQTPVAAGDYYAGPSHCLPTGGTARFASGVSVHTFLRRSGTVHYREGLPEQAVTSIARLAELEGLDAHAESARVRRLHRKP